MVAFRFLSKILSNTGFIYYLKSIHLFYPHYCYKHLQNIYSILNAYFNIKIEKSILGFHFNKNKQQKGLLKIRKPFLSSLFTIIR